MVDGGGVPSVDPRGFLFPPQNLNLNPRDFPGRPPCCCCCCPPAAAPAGCPGGEAVPPWPREAKGFGARGGRAAFTAIASPMGSGAEALSAAAGVEVPDAEGDDASDWARTPSAAEATSCACCAAAAVLRLAVDTPSAIAEASAMAAAVGTCSPDMKGCSLVAAVSGLAKKPSRTSPQEGYTCGGGGFVHGWL